MPIFKQAIMRTISWDSVLGFSAVASDIFFPLGLPCGRSWTLFFQMRILSNTKADVGYAIRTEIAGRHHPTST